MTKEMARKLNVEFGMMVDKSGLRPTDRLTKCVNVTFLAILEQ